MEVPQRFSPCGLRYVVSPIVSNSPVGAWPSWTSKTRLASRSGASKTDSPYVHKEFKGDEGVAGLVHLPEVVDRINGIRFQFSHCLGGLPYDLSGG